MTARRRVIARVIARVLVVLAALAAGPVAAVRAHPGHGTMALVGTLATVSADAVTLDVRDVASGVVTRVRVRIGTNTKLRLKKETLASLTQWVGAAVVATVDYEEGPDGQTVYYATKIQVTPPKKSFASTPTVDARHRVSIIPRSRAPARVRERRFHVLSLLARTRVLWSGGTS